MSANDEPDSAELRAAGSTLGQPPPNAGNLYAQLVDVARLLKLAPALTNEAALVFRRPGTAAVEVCPIGAGVVVGRGEEASLRFEGRRELSRRHFSVMREEEQFYVQDLGSSNGTRIKGRAALGARRILRDGDLIDAGGVVFLFLGDAAMPREDSGP